jgi:hypothetical protein
VTLFSHPQNITASRAAKSSFSNPDAPPTNAPNFPRDKSLRPENRRHTFIVPFTAG